MALTVDKFLEKIGSFGRYQWLLLGIIGYGLIVAMAFPLLIVTFITAEPDWMCVKGCNNSICNFTEPIGLVSDDYQARCNMPREVWTYVDEFTSTVSEYDLVCDNSYLLVVAQSCSWAGMLVGLIIGGYIGDRMGRKIIYYFPVVGVVLATWVMVYPKHFAVFIAGRTFIGLVSGLVGISSFILLTEYTSVTHRAKIGTSLWHFWVTGMPILALMGYLLPHWRDFLLASAIMATPALCLWRFVPESIRWLLLNDKYGEAVKQLAKVAKMNKKEMPKEEITKPIVVQHGNFRQLFYNSETTKRTLISWDVWMSNSLAYYGVTYGSVDLGWNRYLAFALTSLIEYPSNFAAIWSCERFGRKKSTVFGLIFACISLIIAVMIPYEQTRKATMSTIFRIIMAVFAKFFITVSYCCIYVWTAELFPTFIRSTAFSSGDMAAIVGSICASYVIWLIRIHTMLPFGIMAFICFQSSVVTIFLPETKGQATMETMLDLEIQMSRSHYGLNDKEKDRNKTAESSTIV